MKDNESRFVLMLLDLMLSFFFFFLMWDANFRFEHIEISEVKQMIGL